MNTFAQFLPADMATQYAKWSDICSNDYESRRNEATTITLRLEAELRALREKLNVAMIKHETQIDLKTKGANEACLSQLTYQIERLPKLQQEHEEAEQSLKRKEEIALEEFEMKMKTSKADTEAKIKALKEELEVKINSLKEKQRLCEEEYAEKRKKLKLKHDKEIDEHNKKLQDRKRNYEASLRKSGINVASEVIKHQIEDKQNKIAIQDEIRGALPELNKLQYVINDLKPLETNVVYLKYFSRLLECFRNEWIELKPRLAQDVLKEWVKTEALEVNDLSTSLIERGCNVADYKRFYEQMDNDTPQSLSNYHKLDGYVKREKEMNKLTVISAEVKPLKNEIINTPKPMGYTAETIEEMREATEYGYSTAEFVERFSNVLTEEDAITVGLMTGEEIYDWVADL